METSARKSRSILAAGVGLQGLFFILLLFRVEPFYSFFYFIAWWTYILLLAYWNRSVGGDSRVFAGFPVFLWVFFCSNLIWLAFEAFNFRLLNWYYLSVSYEDWLRWPGYFLAFGTVLPAIFETEKFLQHHKVFSGLRGPPFQVNFGLRVRLAVLGMVLAAASLLHPDLFFPAVWLAFCFLPEPFLMHWREGRHSFLAQVASGCYERLARTLFAGLICGILWEFWNYWAGSKWVYSLPYFEFGRIFEMPILGYLGFPFFAVECFLLYALLGRIRERLRSQGRVAAGAGLVCALLFMFWTIAGIDRWTVVSFRAIFQ